MVRMQERHMFLRDCPPLLPACCGGGEAFRLIVFYSSNTSLLRTIVVVFLAVVSSRLRLTAGSGCEANPDFTVFSKSSQSTGPGIFCAPPPIWMCFHNLPLTYIYQDVTEQVEP